MHSFENVRLVIAAPSANVTAALRTSFHVSGFRNIVEATTFAKVHDLLAQDAVDLLISASDLSGGSVCDLVSQLRNQKLGTNPFVVAILLLANPTPDSVRRVIDSGVDDLVLLPAQPDALMSRVVTVAKGRKPFVVTHDYVGPDRRTQKRAFAGPVSLIDVPNPVRIRMMAGVDGNRFKRMVDDASLAVNRLRIERLGVQIDWLVTQLAHGQHESLPVEEWGPHFGRLAQVCEELVQRIRGTGAEPFAGNVREVMDFARRAAAEPAKFPMAEMDKLYEVGKALGRTLGRSGSASGPAPAAPEPAPAAPSQQPIG